MGRNEDYLQIPFRLMRDQIARLDRAARYCGQTRQDFMRGAVLAEVAEVEEDKRNKKPRNLRNTRKRRSDSDNNSIPDDFTSPSNPVGLGFDLQPRKAVEETLIQQAQQQQPVVVNVGTASTTGSINSSDGIDRLAAYVTTGNEFEQEQRLRSAVLILKTTAATEEESKVLAARLDEVIASKTKVKVNTSSFARIAFDKISGLLK